MFNLATVNKKQSHVLAREPKTSYLFLNTMLASPRSISIDGVFNYGGGTGVGIDLVNKSYGEYFERDHFFHDVQVKEQLSLLEVDSCLREKYTLMLSQLSDNSIEDIKSHKFDVVPVQKINKNETVPYFFNGISLTGSKKDQKYFPFSDSCACAVHKTFDASLQSALNEFIERQALLGSWLGKKYNFKIDPNNYKYVTKYTDLIEDLLEHGELYIFQNAINLPGHSIIMFYFAKSTQDVVQYSVGASASFSLLDALDGAFEELWQCYIFLYNSKNTDKALEVKAGADYHLRFKQFNTTDTKKIIPYFNDKSALINTPVDVTKKQPSYSLESIIQQFSNFNDQLFFYTHYDENEFLYYTKIVSPDYFIHMSLNMPLNIENRYSSRLGINRNNAYTQLLPFP